MGFISTIDWQDAAAITTVVAALGAFIRWWINKVNERKAEWRPERNKAVLESFRAYNHLISATEELVIRLGSLKSRSKRVRDDDYKALVYKMVEEMKEILKDYNSAIVAFDINFELHLKYLSEFNKHIKKDRKENFLLEHFESGLLSFAALDDTLNYFNKYHDHYRNELSMLIEIIEGIISSQELRLKSLHFIRELIKKEVPEGNFPPT